MRSKLGNNGQIRRDVRIRVSTNSGRIRAGLPQTAAHSSSSVKNGKSAVSVTLFRRSPRQKPPEMPSGEPFLQEPPVMSETVGSD
ncbi:hypothetical protein A8926_6138 [Saccharopolyspora spinosa]|uniref:Uncharacterized protein n=1 Tax=Saccharopolyspora spinosa TaxID=60894 RepID=A0A2N3Y578_SACSN|nr:hypothetical protein A8926_6138 [Saccharopolyspora spinosa]